SDNPYVTDMAIEDSNSSAESDNAPTTSNSQTDKVQPTNPKNNLNRLPTSNNNTISTSNQDLDKEIKMETDSSNTVTTSELEENIPNAEKAETTSASTKKKKGNKGKLQASNNGIQTAETEATSKEASQSQD
ncbi:7514_t:CDS:1, partial [Scutellospora calospora]